MAAPYEIKANVALCREVGKVKLQNSKKDISILKLKSKKNTVYKTLEEFHWSSLNGCIWGTRIWNRSFKPSMAVFYWRMFHKLLPLDDILKLKGIRLASICHLCKLEEESISHVFTECKFVLAVWNSVSTADFTKLPGVPAICALMVAAHTEFNWKLLLITLWFVWIARNETKHSNMCIQPMVVAVWVQSYWKKVLHCLNSGIPKFKWMTFHWQYPKPNCIKVNIDGCFYRSSGLAAIGGVFRNSRGSCLLYFYLKVNTTNALQAEYLACIHAARLALHAPNNNYWFETDSLLLVNALRKNDYGIIHWTVLNLHKYLMHLLSSIRWCCSHIYREANAVADFLVHEGMIRDLGTIDRQPSNQLEFLLKNDLNSLPYIRTIKS